MKITKSQLKQIVKEELNTLIERSLRGEQWYPTMPGVEDVERVAKSLAWTTATEEEKAELRRIAKEQLLMARVARNQ